MKNITRFRTFECLIILSIFGKREKVLLACEGKVRAMRSNLSGIKSVVARNRQREEVVRGGEAGKKVLMSRS